MIEAELTSLLNADATVTGLISGRLYPLLLPESPTYPAATYQVVSSVPQYTLDGPLGLWKTRVECNAWGSSYLTCKNVSAAIRNVLENYAGMLADGTLVSKITVANVTDEYDSDARLYRVQTDYQLWHSV